MATIIFCSKKFCYNKVPLKTYCNKSFYWDSQQSTFENYCNKKFCCRSIKLLTQKATMYKQQYVSGLIIQSNTAFSSKANFEDNINSNSISSSHPSLVSFSFFQTLRYLSLSLSLSQPWQLTPLGQRRTLISLRLRVLLLWLFSSLASSTSAGRSATPHNLINMPTNPTPTQSLVLCRNSHNDLFMLMLVLDSSPQSALFALETLWSATGLLRFLHVAMHSMQSVSRHG